MPPADPQINPNAAGVALIPGMQGNSSGTERDEWYAPGGTRAGEMHPVLVWGETYVRRRDPSTGDWLTYRFALTGNTFMDTPWLDVRSTLVMIVPAAEVDNVNADQDMWRCVWAAWMCGADVASVCERWAMAPSIDGMSWATMPTIVTMSADEVAFHEAEESKARMELLEGEQEKRDIEAGGREAPAKRARKMMAAFRENDTDALRGILERAEQENKHAAQAIPKRTQETMDVLLGQKKWKMEDALALVGAPWRSANMTAGAFADMLKTSLINPGLMAVGAGGEYIGITADTSQEKIEELKSGLSALLTAAAAHGLSARTIFAYDQEDTNKRYNLINACRKCGQKMAALHNTANEFFVSAAPVEHKAKSKDLITYMSSVERAYSATHWGQGGAGGVGGGAAGGTVGGSGVPKWVNFCHVCFENTHSSAGGHVCGGNMACWKPGGKVQEMIGKGLEENGLSPKRTQRIYNMRVKPLVSPGGLPQLAAWNPSPAAAVMDTAGRVALRIIFAVV